MVLRVVIQPSGSEATEIMAEDRILDVELVDVVVNEAEMRHLEPEGENASRQSHDHGPAGCDVARAPPSGDDSFQGCREQRSHPVRKSSRPLGSRITSSADDCIHRPSSGARARLECPGHAGGCCNWDKGRWSLRCSGGRYRRLRGDRSVHACWPDAWRAGCISVMNNSDLQMDRSR